MRRGGRSQAAPAALSLARGHERQALGKAVGNPPLSNTGLRKACSSSSGNSSPTTASDELGFLAGRAGGGNRTGITCREFQQPVGFTHDQEPAGKCCSGVKRHLNERTRHILTQQPLHTSQETMSCSRCAAEPTGNRTSSTAKHPCSCSCFPTSWQTLVVLPPSSLASLHPFPSASP